MSIASDKKPYLKCDPHLKCNDERIAYCLYIVKDKNNPLHKEEIGRFTLELVSAGLNQYIDNQKLEYEANIGFYIQPVIYKACGEAICHCYQEKKT